MSQLAFWQPNTIYPTNSYILDGAGNIQFTSLGGTSGASEPVWTTSTTLDGSGATQITWNYRGIGGKSAVLQKVSPVSPYTESIIDAISYSRGGPDAGKVVLLNSSGQLDASMGGGGGGGSAWSAITSGTNSSASMDVGTGASLYASGSGVINATEINGIPITGTLTHAGQIPISQPGNASAVWADPLVQGLYAPGVNVLTANPGSTPINPVLVGAQGPTNLLSNLHVDSGGNLLIAGSLTLSGSVSVSNFPATQAVTQSGTWNVGISGTPTVTVSGAVSSAQSGIWSVGITGTPSVNANITNASLPVTGTFWQATQPVSISGTVNTNITNASVTVAGTVSVSNFPATQPVSIASTVDVLVQNSSIPVTGTFWQATQPVSIASTVNVAGTVAVSSITNPVAVTGTFWQATQPVSIASAVTANIQASGTALTATGSSLNVNITGGGGGGGTQYTDGTTNATPTGTVALGKNPSNVLHSLALDSSGNLLVNVASGSTGNAAAGPTGSAVPSQASYTGFNSSGNLVGVSASNPLPVTVSGGGGSAVTQATNSTFLFTRALVNISSAGTTTVIAAVGGQTVRIYRMSLVVAQAVTIDFEDTSSTILYPATAVTAGTTIQGEFDTQPKFPIAVGAGFVINLGTAANVTGFIDYIQS